MISSSFKPEDAHKLMKRCQQDPLFFSTYVLGGDQIEPATGHFKFTSPNIMFGSVHCKLTI